MDLIYTIIDSLKGWADMTSIAKAGAVIMTFLALWKSSLVAPLWEKLGSWKVLVAPGLGVALALIQLPWHMGDNFLSVLWTGIQTGAVAMGFHLLVGALESIPKIGDKYGKWLDFVDTILFKPKAK